AFAPDDVAVLAVFLEGWQQVAEPLGVGASDPHGVAAVQSDRPGRHAALVVEVPDRDVQNRLGPRRTGVGLDLDRLAEQVHMPGDAAHGLALLDLAGAALGLPYRLAAAEQMQVV